MVNINKSNVHFQCLDDEKLKQNGTYLIKEVIDKIKEDFLNKCYICEYKNPPTINIEHFVPHKGNNELKFDWNNLFWACGHCNNIKLDKYNNNILNCTKIEDEVENVIKYNIIPFPKARAEIIPLVDTPKVNQTVQLLNEVYNGTTPLKIIEAVNISDELSKEIFEFQKLLYSYTYENPDEETKKYYTMKVKYHLSRSSSFTAFKRWIIKQNDYLLNEFKQYLD